MLLCVFISVLNCYFAFLEGSCEIACCKADMGVGGPVLICGFRVFCNVADTSIFAGYSGRGGGDGGAVIFGKYEFWNHK